MSGRTENTWAEPVVRWHVNPVDYAGKQPVDYSADYFLNKYSSLIDSDPIKARQSIIDELNAHNKDWHSSEYKKLFDMLNNKAVSFTESDSRQKNILSGIRGII